MIERRAVAEAFVALFGNEVAAVVVVVAAFEVATMIDDVLNDFVVSSYRVAAYFCVFVNYSVCNRAEVCVLGLDNRTSALSDPFDWNSHRYLWDEFSSFYFPRVSYATSFVARCPYYDDLSYCHFAGLDHSNPWNAVDFC